MVSRELRHLRSELDGLKLTLRAKRHIAGAMKRTGPVSVNIDVRPETAEALREATHAHNLVRDAFMARLLIFLRSTDAFLKYLEMPLVATSRRVGSGLEEVPASPLKAMEAVRDDRSSTCDTTSSTPGSSAFAACRCRASGTGPPCYLADQDVAGTAAYRREEKVGNKLLAVLEDAPARTPTKTRRTKK